MPEKIIQVIGNGEPGGGTTAVLTLSQLLQDAGHTVSIASQQGSYLLDAAGKAGIATHGLEFASRGAAIGAWSALSALLQTEQPSVMHAHGGRAGLPTALAFRLGRQCRQKVSAGFVYTVHGFHFPPKSPLPRHLGRLAEKLCIGTAHWTNFVSQGDHLIAEKAHLLAHPERSGVIANAVMSHDLPMLGDGAFDIVYLGRLTPQKNPLILPDIIAALRPLKPSMQIVGGGELEAALKSKVHALGLQDQFTFHGQQDRASALALAARCRLLLLPSRWEGHPITVIEAMHLGLPVVASRISGTSEIVKDGITGTLVAPDDANAYADAIRCLLADPELAKRMGLAGQSEAKRLYSPENMLAANLQVYRNIHAHAQRPTVAKGL